MTLTEKAIKVKIFLEREANPCWEFENVRAPEGYCVKARTRSFVLFGRGETLAEALRAALMKCYGCLDQCDMDKILEIVEEKVEGGVV